MQRTSESAAVDYRKCSLRSVAKWVSRKHAKECCMIDGVAFVASHRSTNPLQLE